MSTLNLLYNTNNPGIHYIVSAGQNINITEVGTYNVVPIDLQALIGGNNKSMYSDNLFDKVNMSAGGDIICSEEMMNNNDNNDNNMNDNDNNNLLTSSNQNNHYNNSSNNRESNSMLDSCRGQKSDNRYTTSTPLDRNTLFTDNLSKLVFNINQGH